MLMLGKPKGGHGEPEGDEPAGGPEADYAREAFSALKDDDEDGFVQAFLGAVRACKAKAETGGYEDDDDGDEE